MGAAPTKIWSRIRRIKLITIHWNYWFSAKGCDFVEKVIFCELHLRYGLFLEDSVDYGAPSQALWAYEMFSKVSHPRWSIKQASTFWKRTILNQHSELWKSFHKKKKFLYSYICDLEHFQMISLRTVVLGWGNKLMWWFYGIPPTMNNETADRITKKNG